jgi:hypothetical protein
MGKIGLRDELKNKSYGVSPRPLLSGEKAIFDKLPLNADEKILKTTAQLLEIFIRVYWEREELTQDDKDFKFVKELYEKKTTNENVQKIFQAFKIEGVGNLIERFVLNLTISRDKIKEITNEYNELESTLERQKEIYQDSCRELRRREKCLALLTRSIGGELEKTWLRWSYVKEAISQTTFSSIWEPLEELIDSQKDEVIQRKEEKDEIKFLKRRKMSELRKLQEKLEKEKQDMFRLPIIFQNFSQVDDTEKIESFSQLIFRFDSLGHQIFWTIFFLVITNGLALIYFYWEKIMAWWNKPLVDWGAEEKEDS